MARRLAAGILAVLLAQLLPLGAPAQQSDLGQIRIVVIDAQSKVPIGFARVLLTGPVIASELTGSDGQVLFTDVPDGIYRARVMKRGYQPVTSAQFEVIEGRAVEVSVSLASSTSSLPVIGHASVRSTATVGADALSQNSAQRKLSGDLADALNKLSGVSVSTSSDDSNATQTVSLEGHDASQTQLTLDGIPLNAPGSAGDLGMFATDLFTGASVRMGPQLGGLGGGVNFTTLEPTLSWQTYATIALGSYGRYNYSLAETGSGGKLGIALETTDRYVPSLVDGQRYLDASGLDYVHDGSSTIGGDLVKLHYAMSDSQTLLGTFLNSTRETGLVCLRLDGAVPCGYGPNNGSQSDFNMYALTDNALLGATTVQASVYGMDAKIVQDELNRYVNGIAEPNGFSSSTGSFGYSIEATLPSRERHTIDVQAYGTASSSSVTPLVPQALPFYRGSTQSSYGALQVNDTIRSGDALTLNEVVGMSHASFAPSTFLGTTAATWHPDARDTYAASYSIGGVAARGFLQTILTDPASLQYDCYGNVAYGSAPGDRPGRSSSTSLRVGYTRTLPSGDISVSLYRQEQNNVVLPVEVNGSELIALGVVPPNYPSLVQPIWDSPAGCNAPPGTPFGATQLYFMTPIGGTQRVYQGAEVTSYLTLGNLVVQPFYDLTSVTVFSRDRRVDNPYSIVIPGKQYPNVPLNRAGITFDYKSPGSAFEYLLDAQYTGFNNWNHLPAHTTLDGGVSVALEHGTLTAIASNFTNTYGGVFTSPQWEVPYTTLGGTTLRNLARPLQPREYSLTYTVTFGQGSHQRPTPTALAQEAPRRGPMIFFGPGPGGRRPAGGRGGFRNVITPLPASAPSQPFALGNNGGMCTGSDAADAKQLSSALQAFTAKIEAAKTSTGYPATMAAPIIPEVTVTYHGLGSAYALTITPRSFEGMRPIIACMAVHRATPNDIAARHLYEAEHALFMVPQIQFMPAVGMYFALRPPQPGRETFRVYALPPAPPRDPFAIRTGGACTSDEHSIAVQLIGELRAHFTRGAATPSFSIIAHTAKAGTWYEIDPGDPATIGALLTCGRVAAATEQELSQRGWDGKEIPELNYTPALGIYMIRPQFGPGGGVRVTSPP